MADLRAAVVAVEKELSFFTARTKVLGNVLAELTSLASMNGRSRSQHPHKRRRMTATAKKAISVRMRKYWVEKRRAEK